LAPQHGRLWLLWWPTHSLAVSTSSVMMPSMHFQHFT